MNNDRGALFCNTCKKYSICYKEDYKDDPEFFEGFCDCNSKRKFIRWERMKDPMFFIYLLEQDLENANHHSQTNLPENIYKALTKKLILSDRQKLDIAKILYKCFYDSI